MRLANRAIEGFIDSYIYSERFAVLNFKVLTIQVFKEFFD
jgi:hypothetical protein